MHKPLIAVDIDDVLAFHAKAMVAYSNRVLGTNLTLDTYTEHWSLMWQVDHDETERRAIAYHQTDDMAHYEHHEDADEVLRKLAQKNRLIIVTARRKEVTEITKNWINKHFNGIFEAIHHAGIFDTKITDGSFSATKAGLCQQLGVEYLIDDQSKHCNAASELGIKTIMFGDYPWNHNDKLHPGIMRCNNWSEVLEYFDAAGRI
jgi:uncharacterized HAD superfamily protein